MRTRLKLKKRSWRNLHVRFIKFKSELGMQAATCQENLGIFLFFIFELILDSPMPWKAYSRTIFMKTFLDGFIRPEGWMEWSGNFALKTLYYGEYANTGSGSATGGRVQWGGYHVLTTAASVSQFTVGNFIAGSS
ncbi:Pectin methylesterase 6 [Heracleum sosnowskyi]|uniref:Pectin methylesterase 6 n=1 Tax=Heracleum sosnowskyi TaxID=360622 RepID=A0AAD8MXP4_9APIA|nr:Pectin methylesterase 6 [Heracleum sosnowskyi]